MRDYYDILGISKGATEEEIKKAYRRLAHQHHPDKNGGNDKKFKEINEAYQILSDRGKRSQYDRFGNAFSGGNPFGAGQNWNWDINVNGFEDMGDLEDIFGTFFEGLGMRQRRRTYKKGGDIELLTEISLEEAQAGKVIELEYETYIQCKLCEGVGYAKGTAFKKCEYCGGQGQIKETRNTFFGGFAHVVSCPECRSAGEIPEISCRDCKGPGRVRHKHKVKVEVREGIESGQIIKIKGMGESGENNATSGDLYVKISVNPHPVFERRGDDLLCKKRVSVIDVLLGREIKVKNLRGDELGVEVPQGRNILEEVRIKGHGMTPRGDLVVKLEIEMPKRLNRRAKELLEDLGKELE